MLKALQIGYDGSLLKTRGSVLESIGLRVITASDIRDAIQHIESVHLDIAILRHSLSPAERREIAAAMHRCHPGSGVVLVSRERQDSHAEADGMKAVLPSDPEKLVRRLRRMLKLPLDIRPQRGGGSPSSAK